MTTIVVEVSEELVALLQQSRLANRRATEQVRFALAIQLFQEGIISIGKLRNFRVSPGRASNSRWEKWGYPRCGTMWLNSNGNPRPAATFRCSPRRA